MSHWSMRRALCIAVIGLAGAPIHPAQAGDSATPFAVEFEDCVESIGVALAPTANVLALTPAGFIPVGVGGPVSPIVVRTADCAGIAVDGGKSKPGSVVQIGAVIVPPLPGVGDINNYTFWYYTTSEKLAHRLRESGVAAQYVANIDYDLDTEYRLIVRVARPADPRFVIAGNVVPSAVPAGSFEALWWQKTAAGNVRMDTKVPVIAIGSASSSLATDADDALGTLIGGGALDFPIVQQFNVFPRAHMDVAN